MEFGKCCEELSCNHRTSTLHRSETNGIAERVIRRVKEGTSAVLLQSELDDKLWSDSMECYRYLRNAQDLLANKNSLRKTIRKTIQGPKIPFGAKIEYHPTSIRDQSRLHQFGKKVLPGIFLGYALIARGIWKGDILIADIEELKDLDASEIYPRRINAKELFITQTEVEFIFPVAHGTAKLSGRDYEFREPTLRRTQTVGSEDLSGEIQGESEEPQPTEPKDDVEVRRDFWSIQGEFNYRHHIEARVQLYVPKEETFPTPLQYIDVTRSTHTNLDVMQEKRIGDYWNVDENRNLSVSWTRFTNFTLLKKEASTRIYVVRGETDKDSCNYQTRSRDTCCEFK